MQIVRDGATGAAEAADRATRARDQGHERATSEVIRGEHAGGDERQDLEDARNQGGQAPREAAEQHEEVHGGAQNRADGAESGEGEA